jgi:hypothetical protein
MKFLLPTGIGDSVWALHKVQDISQKLGDGKIDILLSRGDKSKISNRALDFVRRFRFVRSVEMRHYELLQNPPVTPEGYYNYISDGWYEFGKERVCALIPNASLERGQRLESWLPQYQINWNIFKYFRIRPWERWTANKLRKNLGDYAVFYLGPLHGNSIEGHNRNSLWTSRDWVDLGHRLYLEHGLSIVLVGASYDYSYFTQRIKPLIQDDVAVWVDIIGQTNIGNLASILQNAQLVVSYQAGVGIMSTYLGTPTAVFWRPKGDSISPTAYLSFEESMSSAWVPPETILLRRHLPLIYGRCEVNSIMESMRERRWI